MQGAAGGAGDDARRAPSHRSRYGITAAGTVTAARGAPIPIPHQFAVAVAGPWRVLGSRGVDRRRELAFLLLLLLLPLPARAAFEFAVARLPMLRCWDEGQSRAWREAPAEAQPAGGREHGTRDAGEPGLGERGGQR